MEQEIRRKAIVAMSGGVDSSVAAYLTCAQGYECIGATMKLFSNEEVGVPRAHTCCSLEDVEDARMVAHRLGMAHYVFNFADRFRETVIEPFAAAYERGITPNPCIDCNRYLKFDKLFRRAQELSFDYVVTGHYARIEQDPVNGRWLLKKGLDASKDQSYVLYAMTQGQLAHTRFPLGWLRKEQVREIAQEQGFCNAAKADSQDICFVQEGGYAGFLEGYRGRAYPPGPFVDVQGNVLGSHRGIIRYTVGQRRGLGIVSEEPLYVKEIRPEENTVVLAHDWELYSTTLVARQINLISAERLEGPVRLKAKVRYRHAEQWATVTQMGEDALRVEFDQPQRAITRGQAVVLYDGDAVVGGGTIDEV